MNNLPLQRTLTRLGAFLFILSGVVLLFSFIAPNFLKPININAIFAHMSASGLAALGLTFVIVVRKFDLSFPGIASLGAMTLGYLISKDHGLAMGVAGAIGIGMICGAVNGCAVSFLKLPDIVTTIAVGSISLGLSFLYSGGMTLSDNFMGSGILDISDERIAGVRAPVVIMLGFFLAAFVILHCSRIGRRFYATGENEIAARFSGIRVRTYICLAFVVCAAMSCLSAIILSAQSGRSDVNAGNGLLMPAFASVYLGAALFGRASVPATFAGALLISTLLNGFTLIAMPYYYSDAIISFILIVAIAAFEPRVASFLRKRLFSFGRRPAVEVSP